MTVYNRVDAKECPDTTAWPDLTDNGFFFEWRAECDEKPVVRNGVTCQFREVAYTEVHAKHMLATHKHLIYEPQRRYNGLSIAEYYWVELDGVVDEIMAYTSPDTPISADGDKEQLKRQGRATGLAFAIVHACQPYYPNEQAVSKQAKVRWQERNGQRDWEPTPGFKYDPRIPRAINQYRGMDSPTPTFGKARIDKEIDKLGTKKVGDIKRALTGGMFSAEDLSKVYGVAVDVLEAIAKS